VVHLRGRLKITLKGERARLGYFEENAEMSGHVSLDSAPGTTAAIVAIKSTLDLLGDLANGYRDRLLLWKAPPAQLHTMLSKGALDSRLEAIEVVGARGLRSEIPILLELLTDEDERLRDSSLGALLLLRAREAVPVLTKSREMKNGREMQKILDALAALGGAEAEAYLSFVAETHDSEPIRDLARKSLVRLVSMKKVSATQ
jgi:HEAT repeat protein